jgi:hypothetical protein
LAICNCNLKPPDTELALRAAEKVGFALDFGWRSGLPGLHLILGGAAVYRCDNRLFSAPALAAEVTLRRGKHFFRSRLGFQVTNCKSQITN